MKQCLAVVQSAWTNMFVASNDSEFSVGRLVTDGGDVLNDKSEPTICQ